MGQAFQGNVEDLELTTVLNTTAGELQKTPDEIIALMAFRVREWLRVLCVKARRNSGEAVPSSLAAAWAIFASKKSRASQASKPMPTFFTNYNFANDDDEDYDEEEVDSTGGPLNAMLLQRRCARC